MPNIIIRTPFVQSGTSFVAQGVGGTFSHQGSLYNSWDFMLAVGTQVVAAARGTVVDFRETVPNGVTSNASASSTGADYDSIGSGGIGNFVTLRHEINGQTFYSSYFHLSNNSVPLAINQVVEEGDVIGSVGNTGIRSGTHLHFHVGTATMTYGSTSYGWPTTNDNGATQTIANGANTVANLALMNLLRFNGYDSGVLPSGISVTSASASDVSANTGTEGVLALNSSFTSSIDLARDQDWFRLNLISGQTYTFDLRAIGSSGLDPYLRLFGANGGDPIMFDDNSAGGLNSRIVFTATETGVFYLSAGGRATSVGSYTISASTGTTGTGNPTAGADSISGSSANNTYDGLGGNDTIMGNGGNDTILGGSGNDSLYGGTGNDSLDGGIGADRAYGDSGNDLIRGGDGNDSLFGGSGNDAIRGDAGNDILYGGSGNDTLYGDAGSDVFVFNMALGSTNVEIIVGFSVVDDTMYLDDAIFTRLSAGTLTTAAFARNTTGLASDSLDRIIYETNTGRLYYDADGTGTASARVHFATIATNLAITQSDFFVY